MHAIDCNLKPITSLGVSAQWQLMWLHPRKYTYQFRKRNVTPCMTEGASPLNTIVRPSRRPLITTQLPPVKPRDMSKQNAASVQSLIQQLYTPVIIQSIAYCLIPQVLTPPSQCDWSAEYDRISLMGIQYSTETYQCPLVVMKQQSLMVILIRFLSCGQTLHYQESREHESHIILQQ